MESKLLAGWGVQAHNFFLLQNKLLLLTHISQRGGAGREAFEANKQMIRMIYNPSTNPQLTGRFAAVSSIARMAGDRSTMPCATLQHKQSESNKTLHRFVPLFCFPGVLVSLGLWNLTG